MRAAYNETMDLYFGPNTATPGVYKGTIVGRLVVNTRCVWSDVPPGALDAYFTTDSNLPTAGFTLPQIGGNITIDFDLGDTYVIPALAQVGYVMIKQAIAPFTGTPYFRYFLSNGLGP